MKRPLTFLLVLCLCGPAVAQDLPASMRADKYLLEATRATESGDRQAAQRAFDKFESLDVEPTPLFAYRYGSALVEYGTRPEAWRQGQALLTQFAIDAGSDSEHYTTILELLLAADTKLEAAERVRLQERLPDVLRRLNVQMVPVEGGSFTMGCTPEQHTCAADEEPTHLVQVASFEIGALEVTQDLWQSVMGDNPSAFANCPQCPVETVSWDDIQSFLASLNVAGGHYRLPSEAEWEYAARGGQRTQGHPYAGSSDWAEVAWYYENSGNQTHPVGQKHPNELGLYDMSGNVREWVQDCWQASYDGAPADATAWHQGDCTRRVIRGGSWYGKPSYVRTANRFWYATYFRNNNLGFRLARTVSE